MPLIKCYCSLFFFKRQSLVVVCSRGSAHFLQHAAQSAESRAVSAFVESVMQLLWHTMALGRLVGWWRFRMQDHLAAYGWPGYTDSLSHTHTLVIVSLSVYWQQIVWKFLSLPPPTIEWVNMLYSALTYKTAYAMMCNRLLHVPTNWSLLRGLFETLTYRLHSKFCLRS